MRTILLVLLSLLSISEARVSKADLKKARKEFRSRRHSMGPIHGKAMANSEFISAKEFKKTSVSKLLQSMDMTYSQLFLKVFQNQPISTSSQQLRLKNKMVQLRNVNIAMLDGAGRQDTVGDASKSKLEFFKSSAPLTIFMLAFTAAFMAIIGYFLYLNFKRPLQPNDRKPQYRQPRPFDSPYSTTSTLSSSNTYVDNRNMDILDSFLSQHGEYHEYNDTHDHNYASYGSTSSEYSRAKSNDNGQDLENLLSNINSAYGGRFSWYPSPEKQKLQLQLLPPDDDEEEEKPTEVRGQVKLENQFNKRVASLHPDNSPKTRKLGMEQRHKYAGILRREADLDMVKI
jgi:hypothetical protein